MSDLAVQKVLQQIREIQSKTEVQPSQTVEAAKTSDGFQDLLTESINKVNNLQKESTEMKKAYELGESGVTLPEVMIASQKAGIAFQATLHVRNRFIDAYRDIMNMPL